ncbi:hypothetical protein [Rhizobium leguminosarum]|uniref:hypothetical protein n=1 Tax=Rhizobium leguminosarum TaxID=384 RepID=UPI001C94663F|nr:hypothetical protein [Rhizobium leguminosarum]MBY5658483.1 hypothetical protein [Rhizobium leguminosarum]
MKNTAVVVAITIAMSYLSEANTAAQSLDLSNDENFTVKFLVSINSIENKDGVAACRIGKICNFYYNTDAGVMMSAYIKGTERNKVLLVTSCIPDECTFKEGISSKELDLHQLPDAYKIYRGTANKGADVMDRVEVGFVALGIDAANGR